MNEIDQLIYQILKTIEELKELTKPQTTLFPAGDVAQSTPSLSLAKGGGHHE